MTNYVETHAANAGSQNGSGIVARILDNWRALRSIRRLSLLDDHLLRDIGVDRADVHWAAGLPLTVNAALALEERSTQARRKA